MNALRIDTTSSSPDSVRIGPCVLLVIADESRRQRIEALWHRIDPECNLLSEAHVIDALLVASHVRCNLVLIDGALGAGATALTRHLTHLTPGATVLVFDFPVPTAVRPQTLPWSEAPAACEQWFDHFRASGRATGDEIDKGAKA